MFYFNEIDPMIKRTGPPVGPCASFDSSCSSEKTFIDNDNNSNNNHIFNECLQCARNMSKYLMCIMSCNQQRKYLRLS